MIVNSNRCMDNRFLIKLLKLIPDLNMVYNKITFKPFKSKRNIIYECDGVTLQLAKNNKYNLYITPYAFYSQTALGFKRYEDDITIYGSYYNLILMRCFNFLHYHTLRYWNYASTDLLDIYIDSLARDIKKKHIKLNIKQFKVFYSKLKDKITKYNYEDIIHLKKSNDLLSRKHFGGILGFTIKEIRKQGQHYKHCKVNDLECSFNYYLALFKRHYYTDFKGKYTGPSLYRKYSLDKLPLISYYKFKKLLDSIGEVTIYESKFKVRKYSFYNEKHEKLVKRKFNKQVNEYKLEMAKLKKLYGPEDPKERW